MQWWQYLTNKTKRATVAMPPRKNAAAKKTAAKAKEKTPAKRKAEPKRKRETEKDAVDLTRPMGLIGKRRSGCSHFRTCLSHVCICNLCNM